MRTLDSLLHALDEVTIATHVRAPHDEARNSFCLASNTVGSFDEFVRIVGDYYRHHFTTCVAHGGRMSLTEAAGRAKEIIERDYRRRDGDIVTAYLDAHEGRNGGLRVILDRIAEALQAESVERYTRDMFDRHVAPHDWDDKVAIIQQFIRKFRPLLDGMIVADQPERYARDYEQLVRSFLRAMQHTSAAFRRM